MASSLYSLHRLLILLAISLGVLLLVYGVARYTRTGAMQDLALGVFGMVAGAALGLYLRWFLRKRAQ